MPHTATDSVTTNPDPTKWADRRAEFARGALVATVVTAGSGVFVSVVSVLAAAVSAVSAAAAIGVSAAAFAVALGSVLALAGAVGAVSAVDYGQIQKPHPVARGLGMAFCTLAALGGGAMAHKLFPAPPQKPAEPAPMAVFNITAPNCGATLVQKQIEQIKRDGFRVTCSPTP